MPLIYQLEDPKRPWRIPSLQEWTDFFVRHGESEDMARRSWNKHQADRWKTPSTGRWCPIPKQAYDDVERVRQWRLAQSQRANSATLAQPSPIPAVQPLYHRPTSCPCIPPEQRTLITHVIRHPYQYPYRVRVKAALVAEMLPVFFPLEILAEAVQLRITLKQNPSSYEQLSKTLRPVIASQYGGQP